jgi:hypothetical protein
MNSRSTAEQHQGRIAQAVADALTRRGWNAPPVAQGVAHGGAHLPQARGDDGTSVAHHAANENAIPDSILNAVFYFDPSAAFDETRPRITHEMRMNAVARYNGGPRDRALPSQPAGSPPDSHNNEASVPKEISGHSALNLHLRMT